MNLKARTRILNIKKCLPSLTQAAPVSGRVLFHLVPHVSFGISHLNNRSSHCGVQHVWAALLIFNITMSRGHVLWYVFCISRKCVCDICCFDMRTKACAGVHKQTTNGRQKQFSDASNCVWKRRSSQIRFYTVCQNIRLMEPNKHYIRTLKKHTERANAR